ncbi:MAG: VCBS repeat-containing protein [Calditrichaeota bacterium]|nr:VCBS repeat-containing protein [Calditrichota bacterium]
MKAGTVGIMTALLLALATNGFAQAFAVFCEFDPVLTSECNGGSLLPDGTVVMIFWDSDGDGAEPSDSLPPVGDCAHCVNFNAFAMNGEELLGSPGSFCTETGMVLGASFPQPWRFFLVIYLPGSSDAWVSNVVTIVPGFQEITELEWTCGPWIDGNPPGPVTGLWASDDLCGSIHVEWNPTPNALFYHVFRDGVQMSSTPFTHYDFDAFPPGFTCFQFAVMATNEFGSGPLSNPVQGCSWPPPLPASSVSATDDGCGVTVNFLFTSYAWTWGVLIQRNGVTLDTLPTGFPGQTREYVDLQPLPTRARYTVRGWNAACGEGFAASDSGFGLPLPGIPAEVAASDDECEFIRINWQSAQYADSYAVIRNEMQLAVLPATDSEYIDFPPRFDLAYSYRIESRNSCGSSVSESDSGRGGQGPPMDGTLSASTTEDDFVSLTWNDVSGETGYEIWRTEAGHVRRYEPLALVAQDLTSYLDNSATPGQEYFYRVRAVNSACGNGSFSPEVAGMRRIAEQFTFNEVIVTTELSGAMSAEAADLDDDGDMDIVACGMFADKVAWYENDGSFNFTEHVLAAHLDGARAVAIADIDSDGDLDIAAVAKFANALVWWEKVEWGFWMQPISWDVAGAADLELVNVAGNQGVEILTAASTSGEISRWDYHVDQAFTRTTFANNLPGIRSLASGWYNDPHGLWIVGAASVSGELAQWHSLVGYAKQTIGTYPGITACGLASLNADADSVHDVFFCVADDNMFAWWDMAADSVHTISGSIASPRDVASAFVDSDDRADLLLAANHEVSWWRNSGHRFYRNVIADNLPQASCVRGVDLDGDGDTDVVAAGDHDVRLYLSNRLVPNSELERRTDREEEPRVSSVPGDFALHQNAPNPFNPTTEITFELATSTDVRLRVFDVQGREAAVLANGIMSAERHTVAFDAQALPSGVYFYRLEAGAFVATKKMVLMK